MATQFVSTSHPLSSSAAAPALCGRKMTRLVPTSRIMRPRKRREEKPIQDREKLVVEMLPLVKRVALKIREHLPAHVEVDDLLANGVVGLVDAVAKFDPRKRVKLESYARHRIRGAFWTASAAPIPRPATYGARTKTSKSNTGSWRPSSAGPSKTRRSPRRSE